MHKLLLTSVTLSQW